MDALAEAHEGWEDGRVREQAGELLARRGELETLLQGIDVQGLHAAISRYHGDFHLWRVLVVQGDVFITGLQGPPRSEPIKHSPLRDVASLLCSLELAARQARRLAPNQSPPITALIKEGLERWLEAAHQAVLDGYREGIAGCPSYPQDPRQAGQLIRLFMLEQRLHELELAIVHPAADRARCFDALSLTLQSLAHMQGGAAT